MDDVHRVPRVGELVRVSTLNKPIVVRIVSAPWYDHVVYTRWTNRFPRLGKAAGYFFSWRTIARDRKGTLSMIDIITARRNILQPRMPGRFPLTSIG